MTSWRDHLAALHGKHPGSDSSDRSDSPPASQAGDDLSELTDLSEPGWISGEAPAKPPPAAPDAWLAGIARSVRAALADGAVPVADEDGWLVLVRPDGRRVAVTPHVAAQLAEAGLLPALPDAVAEPDGDDPNADAERAAIQGEPPLLPMGSPERAAADRR
jgi:hypothetical protein